MSAFNPRSYKRSDVIDSSSFVSAGLSIHAPTRGATPHVHLTQTLTYFQSTLLQEERLLMQRQLIINLCFQSTLLQEERLPIFEGLTISQNFQSTLLQEERPFGFSTTQENITFNPRSYKRSDM